MLVNLVFRLVPMVVTVPMITTAISAAIRPYSIASHRAYPSEVLPRCVHSRALSVVLCHERQPLADRGFCSHDCSTRGPVNKRLNACCLYVRFLRVRCKADIRNQTHRVAMMCCTRRTVRRHVLFTISNYKKTRSNAVANDMWGTAAGTGIIRSFFGLRRPRGAVVPFEAPALNMARVCDDERDGLIAILRDFANNGSAYIVPWTSLPLMMSMTERDKALHKAVEELKPSTPAEVRAVVTSLALTGALGPDARTRELALTQSDQSGLADLELILILHLLDSCGADVPRLLASEDRWRDKYARSVVTAAATAIGVRRQEIHQRVAEFGKLLQPIGLTLTDAPIRPGWLRVLHDEIKGFGHNLLFAPERGSPDCGGYLVAIAESCQWHCAFVRHRAGDDRLRSAGHPRHDAPLDNGTPCAPPHHRPSVADLGRVAATDEVDARRAARVKGEQNRAAADVAEHAAAASGS